MNNSFFSRFAPKETKFYPMLDELADILEKAAFILKESLDYSSIEKRNEYYHKIKELEREGDIVSHGIIDKLQVTFITPFDREDIHSLASKLDDVIDGVTSCAKKIAIYNPKPINPTGKKLVDLIHQATVCIKDAMKQLEKFRSHPAELRRLCKELHDIENKSDDVYELFIVELFDDEEDIKELIKIKEIMNELESVTDIAEHVGKIFGSFIVKYS